MDKDYWDFYMINDMEQEKYRIEYEKKMAETYDPNVAEAYKQLLNRVDNGDTSVNENTIQDFLEHHTAMIPTPFMLNHQLHFDCFISKLQIGPYVSDLAYLTKSSDVWNLILIELESPHKKLFKGIDTKPEFTADYYHALQQIKDWEAEISNNKERFLKQLQYIRVPLGYNEVYCKYVIVMGRNNEKREAGKKLIARECELYRPNLSIISYDRLISDYERTRRSLYESIVLTIDRSNNVTIKLLPKGKVSTSIFAYVSCDHLKLSEEQIETLKEQDYEMDGWLNGELLNNNEKYTAKGYASKLSEESLMRMVLENE